MQKQLKVNLLIGLVALLTLTACSGNAATRDWKVFAIEEEPAIDIQFRLPPEWQVDYAPLVNAPGQWEVVLVPPRCSTNQEQDFEFNCISLSIHIKNMADFDRDEFIAQISQNIPLNPAGSDTSAFLGEQTFEVDGLNIQRFNHKIESPTREAQVSIFSLETDNAHYTFFTNFDFDEREGDVAKTFDLLLGSIEVVE